MSKSKHTKIKSITDEQITFTNGDTISFDHPQDCCEWNYADFSHLDDEAKTHHFVAPLRFEHVEGGFRFGDHQRMFFVPCYSEQNGYYTTEIDIYYNGKEVLSFDADFVDECGW